MRFTAIYPLITAFTAAFANSFPVLTPRQQGGNTQMLYFFNIPDVSGSGVSVNYVGVGAPGVCQNLPSFLKSFDRAQAMDGFVCTIFFEYSCSGSYISIGPRETSPPPPASQGILDDPNLAVIKSWKCSKLGGAGGKPTAEDNVE